MTTNLQNISWGSIDDILEGRNENGHLKANILFPDHTPTIDDMDGFDRILCFMRGKVTGGTGSIGRTEVLLTEENGYSEIHPAEKLDEEYETIGLDTTKVGISMNEGEITFSKSSSLTTPGTYKTEFAFFGEDWAEIFVVQIIVTIPLSVKLGSTTFTHGQSITIDMKAPSYSPQYLHVSGSRPWLLENLNTAIISASPTTGSGNNDQWSSQAITLSKPSGLAVNTLLTTTFRILALTQWVDVTVNLHPPTSGQFVDPRQGEAGATGTNDIYIYV